MQLTMTRCMAALLCLWPGLSVRADDSVHIDGYAEMAAYTDSDHVTVLSPSIGVAARDPNAGFYAGARYLVDVVSAASVDIVATASQRWSEVRHQLSGSAGYQRGDTTLAAAASTSIEPDYLALNGDLRAGLALDDDLVTLVFGYRLGHDVAGRTGTPFRVFERTLGKHGPMLGISWVLDPASLLFASVEASFEAGDAAKPYRYVPLFDAQTAASLPNGASLALVDGLRLPESPLERLPTARQRYSVTLRYLRRARVATLRAEERVYVDSWGLLASSSDLRGALDLGRHCEVALSLRLHAQTGASSWRRAYVAGGDVDHSELPAIRTGDRELGPLWTGTVGADLRFTPYTADGPAIRLRIAGMRTSYLNTLFIERRYALLTALTWEGSFE